MSITIRPEESGDEAVIYALTQAAFRDQPHSDGSEPRIVDQLRDDGDLALSLVAINMDNAIIGHIAFSPVTISDGTRGWYGLGPCSVIPSAQRGGIGAALIERGIADMREKGAKGLVLVGNPEIYGRFGFEHDPKLTYSHAPAKYFQRLVLEGDDASGQVTYARAFA